MLLSSLYYYQAGTSQDLSESESMITQDKEDDQEDEMEFIIMREEFSDSETDEPRKTQSETSSKCKSYKSTVLPSMDDEYSDSDSVSVVLFCRIELLTVRR